MRFIHIVLVSLQLVGSFAGAADSEPPVWVIDPSKPGPDPPPAGASLFDVVTLDENGARNVPFPFEKLLQRLEAAAGCSATARCERSVLLPLGRSLQRAAASPDFFASPRIVTAMIAEGRGPLLLRDRLFIGYQERSALLEVISYNDAAGRFEFQIVKNYREGEPPQVFHARREVCLACHQNHAPIFSRQVWDETNANPAIAGRLEKHGTTYHSIAARGSTDVANAIDDATERANRFSLVNLLWREGCGAGEAGERCRAAVLTAALQFALTAQRAYVDQLLRNETAATFHRNAQRLWPGGLAVANPDVPNRDPLVRDAAGPAMAHVPADFEALAPRAPIAVLPADGAKLADALVKGIAESLSPEEVQALSAALDAHKPAARRTLEGRCELQRTEVRIRFACAPRVPDQGVEAHGWIDPSSGAIDSLRIGDQNAIRNLQAGSIRWNGAAATFVPRMQGANARLPDGDAVKRMSLAPLTGREAKLTIVIAEDFAAVRPVIAAALKGRADAFRRDDLRQIVARIGGRDSGGRRLESVSAPAAVEPAPESADALTLIAPFSSQCGACHHTADAAPPNFLSGDAARVRRALQSCAPRIYVRLAMNELPPAERDKTPMPPEFPSVIGRMSAGAPLRGDLLTMRAEVERLLRAEYGRAPSARELLTNGYEALRPCLPTDPLTPALSPRERGDFQP
jgi:hypothetical protein